MKPEFEEKQFEMPLFAELSSGSRAFYAPGPVLESEVGFDFAAWTAHPGLWTLFGTPTPGGLRPAWRWWHGPGPHRLPRLPAFRLNLFVQCKRAHRLAAANAAEWPHWKKPYFRYPLVAHQQAALERCAQAMGPNGLVLYGAPAFAKLSDLFQRTSRGDLVAHTNFVECSLLHGHSKWTFAKQGKRGRAYSDPENIGVVDLDRELPLRRERAPETSDILGVALQALVEGVAGLPGGREMVERSSDAVDRSIEDAGVPVDVRGPVSKYLRADILAWALGVQWVLGS